MTIPKEITRETKLTAPVKDADILTAISLKSAPCYGALSMCNALGGTQDVPWHLCHTYTLKDILDEAKARGLDLSGLKCAVEEIPVTESFYYKYAVGEYTKDEYIAAFSKWKNGK
jgi:hypothetical protein